MHKGRLVGLGGGVAAAGPQEGAQENQEDRGPGPSRPPAPARGRRAAPRGGSPGSAGLEPWGSLNACRGFGMASTDEF